MRRLLCVLDGSETLAIREAASSLGLMFEWLWPILSSTWLELLCLLTRFVCSASEHSYPRSSGVSGEFPGELSHLYLTRLQIYAASSQLLNYSCLYSGRHYGWPCIILFGPSLYSCDSTSDCSDPCHHRLCDRPWDSQCYCWIRSSLPCWCW